MTVIDTHAHFIPTEVVAAARRGQGPDGTTVQERDGVPWMVHRQGYAYPLPPHFHDVDARLRHMDTCGVTRAVLSAPPTFFLYWTSPQETVETARLLNESLAAAARTHPGRLAAVATLPMTDPVAAAAELRRSVVELGLVGAQIGPHVEGTTLDSPRMEPVLATAAELGVPLIIHPYYVGSDPVLHDFYLTNLLGNPWQTTVCASRLMLSGTLDRLPGLKLLLVHGGGYLPLATGRLDHGHRVRPELAHLTARPSEYLRRFHYDTLTHDPATLRWLLQAVGADRVVFGSDTPFDMGNTSLHEQLGPGRLTASALSAVSHTNAESLFGLPEVGSDA